MELIDREAAIVRAVEPIFDDGLAWEVKEELLSMPSIDAVPVVRCAECKWYYGENHFCEHDMCAEDDGYCSWAERKES